MFIATYRNHGDWPRSRSPRFKGRLSSAWMWMGAPPSALKREKHPRNGERDVSQIRSVLRGGGDAFNLNAWYHEVPALMKGRGA